MKPKYILTALYAILSINTAIFASSMSESVKKSLQSTWGFFANQKDQPATPIISDELATPIVLDDNLKKVLTFINDNADHSINEEMDQDVIPVFDYSTKPLFEHVDEALVVIIKNRNEAQNNVQKAKELRTSLHRLYRLKPDQFLSSADDK